MIENLDISLIFPLTLGEWVVMQRLSTQVSIAWFDNNNLQTENVEIRGRIGLGRENVYTLS